MRARRPSCGDCHARLSALVTATRFALPTGHRTTGTRRLISLPRARRPVSNPLRRCGIEIDPAGDGPALMLQVRFGDPRALLMIVERVRRMFDIGADPTAIAKELSTDPLLARALAAHAGIRTPGAWDPFELTVRAILGQQISVRAATTIAGRVTAQWGTQIDGLESLNRLFPTPSQLADAPIEAAGVLPARASTIRALARAVLERRVCFDGESVLPSLRAIAGIGEWTAQYVAMRALNEPDAFPSGDLVLRRMAGDLSSRELDRRSESWRPWRAYAVMLLWQAARDLEERHRRTRHAKVPASLPRHRHGARVSA